MRLPVLPVLPPPGTLNAVSLAPPGWQPRGERRRPVRGGCRFAGKGAGGLGGPWRSSGLPAGSGRGGRIDTVGLGAQAQRCGPVSGLGGVDPDRGATGRGPDLAPLAVAAPAGLAGDPLDALPQQPPAPGAATELGVGAAPGVPRGVDLNVAGESAAIHAGRYAQPPQLVRGCRNCPGHRSTRRGTLSTTVSRPARDSRQLKAPIQF